VQKTELTQFIAKRSDYLSLLVVLTHLAFVLFPVYLAVVFGIGWHLLICWLWFGLSMNGLLNLMHEASHSHVFSSREASNFLGRWVLGPLAFADFDSYRDRHWNHHRRLGEPDDPKITYQSDIRGWRLFQYFVRCLTLTEGMKRFAVQRSNNSGSPDHARPSVPNHGMYRTLIVQAVFAGSLLTLACGLYRGDLSHALLVGIVAYLGIYGYGLASLTVFTAGMRAIAEHQIGTDADVHVGRAALRNFTSNPVSWLLLGAYGFAQHATHHRFPAIPYYYLPSATDNLVRTEPALTPQGGYFGTLISLIRGSEKPPSSTDGPCSSC
jgi:fatty acid desaturase